MKRRFCCRLLGIGMLTAIGAAAQERDYTRGFAHFHRLGLPKATQARYVTVSYESAPRGSAGRSRTGTEAPLQGNGWLLSEDDHKASIIDDHRVLRDVWRAAPIKAEWKAQQKKLPKEQRAPYFIDFSGRAIGTWTEADLDADLEAIHTHIGDLTKQGDDEDAFPGRMAFDSSFVQLFFFSAHLAESGRKADANALLARLFAACGDPAKLVKDALDELAEAQHVQLMENLRSGADWKATRDALQRLRDGFGNTWRSSQGAALLIARLDARLQGVPPLEGAGLTEELQALARDFAEAPNQRLESLYGLWILPDQPGDDVLPRAWRAVMDAEAGTPLGRLRQAGVDALPLLIAMLPDQTLTRLQDETAMGYREHMTFSWRGEDAPAPPSANVQFEAMARPMTRGEVAVRLLKSVVPGLDGDGADRDWGDDPIQPDPAEIAAPASEWYAALRGKTLREILPLYLQSEDDGMRLQALRHAIHQADPADLAPAIEEALLHDNRLGSSGDLVISYLLKRGAAGGDFADRFLTACEERIKAAKEPAEAPSEAAQMLVSAGRGMWEVEQLDRVVQSVKDVLSNESLADITLGYARGTCAADRLQVALGAKSRGLTRQEFADAVLRAADAAGDPRGAARLLDALLCWQPMPDDPGGTGPEGEAQPYRPEPHLDLWRKLLADQRLVRDPWSVGTVAMSAALALESCCAAAEAEDEEDDDGQAEARRLGNAWSLPPDRATQLAIARAEARLAGRPVAELPSLTIDELDPETGAALAARLTATADAELPAAIQALTNAEYLALAGGDHEDLWSRLAPWSTRIAEVSPDTHGIPLAAGQTLSVDALKAVVEHGKTLAADGQALNVTLVRWSPLSGFSLTVEAASAQDESHGRMGGAPQAMVTGLIAMTAMRSRILHADATWTVAPKERPGQDTDALGSLETEWDSPGREEDFWVRAKLALDPGKANPFACGSILFSIRPAAAKTGPGSMGFGMDF